MGCMSMNWSCSIILAGGPSFPFTPRIPLLPHAPFVPLLPVNPISPGDPGAPLPDKQCHHYILSYICKTH